MHLPSLSRFRMRHPRPRRRSERLCLEPLESRVVPSNNSDAISGVALDAASNVYVMGTYSQAVDLDPGPGQHWLTAGSGPYGGTFIAKYTPQEQLVWALDQTALPSTRIVGRDLVVSGSSLYANGGGQIDKFDLNGNLTWSVTTYDESHIAVDDADGSVYAFGQSTSTSGVDVAKWDANGNFQWSAPITGSGGNQWAKSVAVHGGIVYAAGFFSGTVNLGGFTFSDQGVVGQGGSQDGFLATLNASGTVLSASQFPDALIGCLAVDDTGIYLGGYYDYSAELDPSPTVQYLLPPPPSGPNDDGFYAHLNPDGTFGWAKSINGTTGEMVRALTSYCGDLYVTGFFGGTDDFDPGPGTANLTAQGGYDTFVLKVTAAGGAYGWAKQMGSSVSYPVYTPYDTGAAIAASSPGVFTGGTFAPGPADFGAGTYAFTGNDNGSDAFLSSLAADGSYQGAFTVGSTVRTIDDLTPGYVEAGKGWKNSNLGGYNGESRMHAKGGGVETATWTFANLPPGTYAVYATWKAYFQNATNAPYSVNGTVVTVNQQVSPNNNNTGVIDDLGRAWKMLVGQVVVGSNGTIQVVLSDQANGNVIADAVRVVFVAPPAGSSPAGAVAFASPTQTQTAFAVDGFFADSALLLWSLTQK